MKKVFGIIAVAAFMAACNSASEGNKTPDTPAVVKEMKAADSTAAAINKGMDTISTKIADTAKKMIENKIQDTAKKAK